MDALYVVEPGSYLRKDGDRLRIVKQGSVVSDVPAQGLKRLTLVGHLSLSGAVLDFLIRHRIETVFLTPTGRYRARLMLDEHPHVALRQAQYARLSDRAFALRLAKTVVRAKLENQVRFLQRRARDYAVAQLAESAVRIRGVIKLLEGTAEMEAVRGMEGYGTRVYFGAFPLLLRNEGFSFKGRNRRPPRDPVNAMLSFVYTMVTNEVLSAVKAVGLDPYLGALHEVAHGRPSLACDLVEEWRTLADRVVLTLVNRRYVTPDDFVERPPGPPDSETGKRGPPSVQLKPEALRALIRSVETQMQKSLVNPATGERTRLRWMLHEQVRRFARCLEDPEVPYRPFQPEA